MNPQICSNFGQNKVEVWESDTKETLECLFLKVNFLGATITDNVDYIVNLFIYGCADVLLELLLNAK